MVLYEKNILITNDDGIHSPGIRALVNELKEIANIYIIAPERQQSGEGKAITFDHPLRIRKVEFENDNVHAYTISGTPADAVIYGIKNLAEDIGQIDFTISGINAGENTSIHSMLTSGTCAAAFESALMRTPAIAFSLATPTKEFFVHENNKDFIVAAKIAKKITLHFLKNNYPKEVSFFNVNFPSNLELTTPIHETDLSFYKYNNYALKRNDPRNIPYYWIWGDMLETFEQNSDTDIVLTRKEISISAVNINHWLETKKYGLNELL